MNFYCIIKSDNKSVRDFIIDACKKRSINYFELDPSTSKLDILAYPKPMDGDLLYRASANDANSRKIEYAFAGNGVVTFYDSPEVIFRPSTALKLPKAGIPTPETIPVLTSNRMILKGYADHLGGFPLIIKALGGKEGVGVMRIDSMGSFFSVADYLYKSGGNYIIRKYVDVMESVRAIVIGQEVVACIKYKISNADDFRSNRRTGFDYIETCECSEEIKNLAVSSVSAMDLEFGGVDIMIDSADQGFVLEVNFPCNFGDAQIVTGVDIAGLMLDHLVKKAARTPGRQAR